MWICSKYCKNISAFVPDMSRATDNGHSSAQNMSSLEELQ